MAEVVGTCEVREHDERVARIPVWRRSYPHRFQVPLMTALRPAAADLVQIIPDDPEVRLGMHPTGTGAFGGEGRVVLQYHRGCIMIRVVRPEVHGGAELFDYAYKITEAGIRMQHPEFNDEQVKAELRRRIEISARREGEPLRSTAIQLRKADVD